MSRVEGDLLDMELRQMAYTFNRLTVQRGGDDGGEDGKKETALKAEIHAHMKKASNSECGYINWLNPGRRHFRELARPLLLPRILRINENVSDKEKKQYASIKSHARDIASVAKDVLKETEKDPPSLSVANDEASILGNCCFTE